MVVLLFVEVWARQGSVQQATCAEWPVARPLNEQTVEDDLFAVKTSKPFRLSLRRIAER